MLNCGSDPGVAIRGSVLPTETARTDWAASTARKRALCAPLKTLEWIANRSRLD